MNESVLADFLKTENFSAKHSNVRNASRLYTHQNQLLTTTKVEKIVCDFDDFAEGSC